MIERTHWDGCWKSGPEHYECAVAVAEDAHKAQRQAENDLSKYMARCAMAEAEVERLRAEKDAIKVAAWDKSAEALKQRNAATDRAEKAEAEVERLRETLKSTATFLHHCWCEVQMNDYSFQKLNEQMEIVDAAIDAAMRAEA